MTLYLGNHPLRALLFDFDGTLVDTSDSIVESFVGAFRLAGLPVPGPESVRRLIGYPLREAFARLAPYGPVDHLVEIYRREFWERSRNGARLFPGARSLLEFAATHGRVGIVSSRSHRGVVDLLEFFDLERYVSIIVAADDVAEPKPSALPVLEALRCLEAKPTCAVMIGDTPLDMAAGRSAGVLPLGVLTGSYPAEELVGAGAHLVYPNLRTLQADLREIPSSSAR
ncbi:MAG TPA: HAD family hydrolase [Acidobacteriota bacterium]|jgi:HAD superfamily hydrolase (TIGR01549 family)|nr:HAD family hydrolase [Acidobacteriota bacterium]HRV06973.1 HAD family hydrolase [Acidobacteriota bacterium]